ncbi:exo-alpha-sialidase [Allorhodopirellula solitaria]|uniref:Sialidase n=1 Tax=Allorhodopirellula solitaria TaxID=2527987 RepID=A0A5C5XSG7_9BACT|nr:exo-alpha-sialidase [Allorhodopirellula solitaria]TWT65323.1 Sialidase precursor [Allorhodopirellula solitaria]
MRTLILTLLLSLALLVPDLAGAERTSISLDTMTRQRCLDVLRSGLRSDDFWPSIHAAEGLTLAGHGEEVINYLTDKLAAETDDQRRCGLARELVRAGDKSQVSVMLGILAGEDSHGHIHAAESLYKVVEIGDGAALRKTFATAGNGPLKLMAAAALGRCGNPDAMLYLRESLSSKDPDALRIAAWILGRIGSAADIPLLKAQLPRCETPVQKAYIHHSLAALGDAEGHQALAENLHDRDPAIRTYAATFAGDAWATDVADSLKQLLDDENADTALRAAQSLLVLSGPAPEPADADISIKVFPATLQHPRYTEGSIITLQDGSLLFAVTEFHGSGSDFAHAHIIGRRSTDGGRTWSASRVLHANTGSMNVMSVTLRRLANGAIAMFYLQKNSHSDLTPYLRISTDEAETFGDPVQISSTPGYHVVNNDRVTELSTGRLLMPAASSPDVATDNHFRSHCFLSDDGGKTWRDGIGNVDADKRGAMEPEVVELKDGRIMMLARTQLGYPGKAYSEDGGDTWGPLTSLGVQGPEAPATVRRIPSTGDLLLIWNNTYTPGAGHGGKRTPLTAALSRDEGEAWTVVGNLESDPSRTFSYISLTFVRDRAVMSYWDQDKAGYSCRFRSLPVSWFYR